MYCISVHVTHGANQCQQQRAKADVLQRELLERLTALLVSQLGSHVAVAVTSLGALGLLMEILGEIEAEEMERVENVVGDKLIQTSSPLRRQVRFPAVLHMPPNGE